MSQSPSNSKVYGNAAKVILELAAGWILISGLAFVVGLCVVRLMGVEGGSHAPASNSQLACKPDTVNR